MINLIQSDTKGDIEGIPPELEPHPQHDDLCDRSWFSCFLGTQSKLEARTRRSTSWAVGVDHRCSGAVGNASSS
ncbi:unnamed protein product [Prorocentrum cordatum]|uniref:Uncharacterized protein n=1 Tax=Prorocentrum cordatum TaxID=2364126 RepID=A0ABN9U827_9DINO|nr:unnamed protein product [Polarella glacialis]